MVHTAQMTCNVAVTDLATILRCWDVVSDSARLITSARDAKRRNLHWRIQSAVGTFVLRAYRVTQTAAMIDYELAVLRHLHGRGWPVAMPVGPPVWRDSRAFALFPLLPGAPRVPEGVEQTRDRGRLLARLHRDLDVIADVLGQRPGWKRTDVIMSRTKWQHAQDALASLRVSHADVVQPIILHVAELTDRLPDATKTLPTTIVHGDLIAQNVLFQHSQLTGIIDFDSTHLDLRAADIACARRNRNDAVVVGYSDVSTISGAELRSVGDLWKATVLRYAWELLHDMTNGPAVASELAWCAKQLEQTRTFA
jgi:Ser/Thr protein kinase RdoA (MazF antagonist)